MFLRLMCLLFLLQVVSALHYLHAELKVIHRDVKPSNILINRRGEVKMCDFGISGYLVDSVAKTVQAGCKPYMAVSMMVLCLLQETDAPALFIIAITARLLSLVALYD